MSQSFAVDILRHQQYRENLAKLALPNAAPKSNGHCPSSPVGAHWWIIADAAGAISEGVCKYCQEHRSFWNSFDGAVENVNKGRSSRGGRKASGKNRKKVRITREQGARND